MEEIKLLGKQKFMGINIPIVAGGFGPNKRCISDKTIAEIHGMEAKHVREAINKNISRFKENIDFIDFAKRVDLTDTLLNIGYSKQSITQAEHIYILSERGYGKVIKIFNTDLAWEIYDKLLDEYFEIIDNYRNTLKTLESIDFIGKNELVFFRDGEARTDVAAISALTHKRKSDVMRDIRDELNKLENSKEFDANFRQSQIYESIINDVHEIIYLDTYNREQKTYELGYRAAMQIMARYSAEFRAILIDAFISITEQYKKLIIRDKAQKLLPQYHVDNRYVYVLRNISTDKVKIGVSNNVKKRVSELECSGCEIEICYISPLCSNHFNVEEKAHDYFTQMGKHEFREWFNVTPDEAIQYLMEQNYTLKSDFSKIYNFI